MDITISKMTVAGKAITSDMFGGNALVHRSQLGEGGTDEAFKDLGMVRARYPGGSVTEQLFDVNNPDTLLLRYDDMPTDLEENHLKFSDFMAWAERDDLAVNFVLPTHNLIDRVTGQINQSAVDDTIAFVRILTDPNGPYAGVNIDTLEIGNEYWGSGQMTAEQYGKVANALLPKLQGVVAENGQDADLLVQIGTAWGSEFKPGGEFSNVTKWSDKLTLANEKIVGQLGKDAMAAIDGIVEHVYHAPDAYAGNDYTLDFSSMHYNLGKQLEAWRDADIDAPLAVTEWNIKSSASEQGLMGASAHLEIFSQMASSGVEWADAWPVQLNSRYNLGGKPGEYDQSFSGAAFEMISLLDGYRPMETGTDGKKVEVNAWSKSKEDMVFHVMSRSSETEEVDLDLRGVTGDEMPSRVRVLSYDPESADGRDWRPGGNVDVEKWNDHGSDPVFEERDVSEIIGEDGKISFTLNPFEVVELVYGDVPTQLTDTGADEPGVPVEPGGDHDVEVPPGEDPDTSEPPPEQPPKEDPPKEDPETPPPVDNGPSVPVVPNPEPPPEQPDPEEEAPAEPEPPIDTSPSVPEEDEDDEEEPSGGGSGGGGCFVATAAYGSPDHSEVAAMRRLRDDRLMRHPLGRAFVRAYWTVGPHMAARVRAGGVTGRAVRALVSAIVRRTA